ncbi:MAG: methyltransferase family protein [Planctomycetota bacterium]|jgi:protein-S-isoprenylcysteine O-methyltransferase Ste14
MRIGQVLLLGIAALLLFFGGYHYDARQFLGIRQIKERTSNKVITNTGELDTSGILSISRHPWYLATILLIWARPLDVSAILTNVILTSYVIVGTYLEEKKLAMEFGEKYLAYQKRVSMLIPYKWLKLKIIKGNDPLNHANSSDS